MLDLVPHSAHSLTALCVWSFVGLSVSRTHSLCTECDYYYVIYVCLKPSHGKMIRKKTTMFSNFAYELSFPMGKVILKKHLILSNTDDRRTPLHQVKQKSAGSVPAYSLFYRGNVTLFLARTSPHSGAPATTYSATAVFR